MADNSLRNRYRRDFTTERISTYPTTGGDGGSSTLPATEIGGLRYEPVKAFLRSSLARDVLICVVVVITGLLVLNDKRSNADKAVSQPKSQAQTQTPAVAQKQPASASNTSTLGATSSQPSASTQAPSSLGSLPTSFHVNNDKQTSGGITTYSISDDSNNTYNVVEEPITATNTQASFAKSLTNTETLSVPLGSAIIGESNSELVAGIQTSDNHLIIIEAPATNLRTQLEALAKSM